MKDSTRFSVHKLVSVHVWHIWAKAEQRKRKVLKRRPRKDVNRGFRCVSDASWWYQSDSHVQFPATNQENGPVCRSSVSSLHPWSWRLAWSEVAALSGQWRNPWLRKLSSLSPTCLCLIQDWCYFITNYINHLVIKIIFKATEQRVECESAVHWKPGRPTLSWGKHQAQHYQLGEGGDFLLCSALGQSAGSSFECHRRSAVRQWAKKGNKDGEGSWGEVFWGVAEATWSV